MSAYELVIGANVLPISAQLVTWLHHLEFGSELNHTDWWDQAGEGLTVESFTNIEQRLGEVLASPARHHVRRCLDVVASCLGATIGR